MSDTRLSSGDKEVLSPRSQPMYLRASALPDPEPLDPVERCLFADSDECSTDASDTCKAGLCVRQNFGELGEWTCFGFGE